MTHLEEHNNATGGRSYDDLARLDIAIVVRGRKVKPGVMGVVCGVASHPGFGYRAPERVNVGMVTAQGMIWVSINNVERYAGSLTTEERDDMMVAWIANDRAFRASTGRPATTDEAYAQLCRLGTSSRSRLEEDLNPKSQEVSP
jgi:hypothetical protein